ncbi:MAG: phenylalanine--tRNA ligase subunit beta [Myxococcota bacterium]|nr:phenylalanine--tRNA ligase subunit beta [Myxococcota bacterium]
MRVPLGWLAEWVDLPPTEALAHRLTMGGLEIEEEERTGPDLSAFRVGHVLERTQHPNADRLSLCTVDLGDGEPVEIVCGAPNVAAGQKVAVAPVGAKLPDGTRIKKSKIRSVVSRGMICSTRELGLGDEHEGILVLDAEAPVGAPLGEVIAAGDTVLDLFLTANRGDCASLLGVAREVRAHFGGALRLPPCEPETEEGDPAAASVRIEIDDRAGCHQYVARIVRGVALGPSPDWLQQRLEAAGMRPVNVVVDVTNLVLLELGQPLHAFDLATLRGGVVRVRRAEPDEKLVTLDGQTRALDPDDVVIADGERAIAVAGVMGGAETEVGDETTDVLIESAHFDPRRVRRTGRRLGLSSEASYRFERGVDREGIRRAADRAAHLLAELAQGSVAPGVAEAEGDAPAATESIELDPTRVNRLLGTGLSPDEVVALLARVGVEAAPSGDALRCRVPSWRNDLHRPVDLIEEVARIHGYEHIPVTLPAERLTPVAQPRARAVADCARDALSGLGLVECMTLPMCSAADLDRVGLAPDDPRRRAVALANPLVDEESQLRTSLVPALLGVVRQNRARQLERVRVFELGRVFLPRDGAALPDEPLRLAAVLTRGDAGLWDGDGTPPIYFEAKGVVERLLAALGVEPRFAPGAGEPYLHPGASAALELDDTRIGALGELHPEVAARYEIAGPCALLTLDLEALVAREAPALRFREVSRQPQVRRDLALVVGRESAADALLGAIRATAGPHLVSAEVFDRYEGKGVPEGKISLAFRLVFQRPDRTLTDKEVTRSVDRVVGMLADRFRAELRQGSPVGEQGT